MRRIVESVLIDAPRDVAWGAFADLAGWADWNRVLTGVRAGDPAGLAAGCGFSCRLRPFAVAIPFAVRVEIAEPPARLLWVADRWGVRARHWFRFAERPGGATLCESDEELGGATVALAGPLFPSWRFRALTRRFLADLKAEAERRRRDG
jgi:hypothetical protein